MSQAIVRSSLRSRCPFIISAVLLLWALFLSPTSSANSAPLLHVQLAPGIAAKPLSGRLLVMFAPVNEFGRDDDLRLSLSPTADAIAFFGVDVTAWRPGQTLAFGPELTGFPHRQLADLPSGTYRLQISFERYADYRRNDGHSLRLPEIEPIDAELARETPPRRWRSAAEQIVWDGRSSLRPLLLAVPIAHSANFKETPWVKSVRIRSDTLSQFWGRDVYLGALVTLPVGYERHRTVRYPLLIRLGGLPLSAPYWRETPPDIESSSDAEGVHAQQAAWENFQYWQASATPRMLLVDLQHPTPYADTSLAVNSLNYGPYADAIRRELIPAIEREYRTIAAGWARFVFGSADGGWSALALQSQYPNDFNGAWAACPDPVDFRHFGVVDLQQDTNAFFKQGPHLSVPRPARRDAAGAVLAELSSVSRWELALAARARSQEDWDRWEAAFSPVDDAGYPRRIWDRETGIVDGSVAEHWYQQHDLQGRLLAASPAALGALRGKLHIRIGDRDEYFFDNAVRAFEAGLRARHPDLELSVDYGRGVAACWGGRHDLPAEAARWRSLQDALPWALERILRTAPVGADLASWRY